MKQLKTILLGIAFVGLIGCSSDDNGTTPPPPPPTDQAPTITLSAPSGGAAVMPGGTVTITWTAMDDNQVVGVDLSYTDDNNATDTPIASDLEGTSFDWTTPDETLYGVTIKGVVTDDAAQTGEDTTEDIFAVVAFSERGYVTAETCADCHPNADADERLRDGHRYKLNKVVDGTPPTYPNSTVPNPPAGSTWDDVTYVIGGYGWKARFIGTDGYIITAGGNNQWNLATEEWVDYHKDELKPYDCGPCHMTGWQTLAENGGVNQDGLVGIEGTWEEPGVRCEECHGPGVDHVSQQVASEIDLDLTSEACGKCHQRGGLTVQPEASGGFIRHHEQYNEWLMSAHADNDVGCGSCHDAHIGVSYGNPGIIEECEGCHGTPSNAHLVPIAECETCHLAQATKSATKENEFVGDVKTHIFTINPGAVGKDAMFFTEAGTGKTRTNAFVTLDFVCYQCHKDPLTGEGGSASTRTLAELSARATGIHGG